MDDREFDILVSDAILARRRHAATDSLRFGAGVAVVLLLLVLCVAVASGEPEGFDLSFLAGAIMTFSAICINLTIGAIVCWPIFLTFFSTVRLARQDMLLLLIQTAMETATPIGRVLRSYALTISPLFPARHCTDRLALALQSGQSLRDALQDRTIRPLLRGDLLSAMELGECDQAVVDTLQHNVSEQNRRGRFYVATMLRFIYLFVLAFFFLFILSGMMILIVPKFVEIFRDFDTELPGPTVLLMHVANWFVMYWYLFAMPLILFLPILFCGVLLLTGVVDWRPWGFRKMFNLVDSARLLLVLRVGVERNLPLETIFKTYIVDCPVPYLRERAARTLRRLDAGMPLPESLRREGYLDRGEAALLEAAERVGNAPFVLRELGTSKEQRQMIRADYWSKVLFLPCILTCAGIVGFTVVALFMPLTRLIGMLS